MKKKLLFLAIAALLTALLCVSALASSDGPGLWVGGVEVTSANASNITGEGITGGTVSYDAATKTLKLNGATLSGSHNADYFTANIYAKNDLNIVLIGDNKVEYGDNDAYLRAIYVSGDLNISGNGSLTCGDSKTEAAFDGHGIYCGGDLAVQDATLNFHVKYDGIYCSNGDVKLNNAKINFESEIENSDCISGNNITITGGEVKLESNGAGNNDSYGIYGDNIVEICDAKVEIQAYYCGIRSFEALKVTGDNTNLSVVLMEDASEDFLAISAPYISVNGTIYSGELKALVVENEEVSSLTALNAPTKVYVNDVDIKSDSVPGASYDDDTNTLTLNGADLITGHEYGNGLGAVIYADGDLNIMLVGENTVTARDSSIEYFDGIDIDGTLTLSGGGSLTVNSDCIAIYTNDNASFIDCTVKAKGINDDTIYIGDDMYVFEGARIEATSTTDYGIETGDGLIVYGGKITAVNESGSTAMDIDDNMEVYGGSIIATNKSGGKAIDIDDDLLVYGGSVDATGNAAGIYMDGHLSIEGGSVSATATADNGAALYFEGGERVLTIGETAALTLNAATPVEVEEGDDPYTLENNGGLTVYVDSVEEISEFIDVGGTLGFVLSGDITGTVTIPAGADVTISGGNEKHTLTGQIKCTVDTDNTKTTRLTLDGLTLDGGGTQKMAVISQDQESKTVRGLELTMTGCTVENYTDKAVYLTNATALNIDDCTFTNNATGDMDDPNTKGDYTIDLNLVSVDAGELSITDSSFEGTCGDKAVIKVAARGGASDDDANDISGSAATVEKLTVSGCTFSAEDSAAHLNIGTDNKSYSGTGDAPVNSTGSFAVSVSGNTTEVKINEAFKTYKNEDGNYIDTDTGEALQNTVVAVGESATKTDTGELEVKPDEPDEPDIPDLPVIPDIPVVTPPTSDDEPDFVNPYTDVAEGAWYESAVRYAYTHDIMEGMSATTFQPNGTLTRAMAVQIFYNLEGQPDISDENLGYPYEDVNAQAWYGDAVYWARLTGVATGYGDGTFQPTDSITRQEFAQMLYNYAKYKGCDLTAEGDLSQFPDSGSVADWAEIAMEWANGNELINGHDDGTLEPGGTTTRAQAAAILMRFDQDLAE